MEHDQTSRFVQDGVHARDAADILGQNATVSMADRAYNYLMDSLSNGTLRGGDTILESRLAERMDLSRTPIRDALGRLEGEGLLVRAGRTLTVRRVTVKEFLDLLHVRRLIEPEAAFLACGKIDPNLLEKWREVELAYSDETVTKEQWSLDEEIHLTIVMALQNDYLADLVRNLRRRTRLFELTEFPGSGRSGRKEHLRLIGALINEDASEAKAAMLTHLETLRADVVDLIRQM
ncbi:GntR family transcriptional regulator [Mesorhizobium sp. M7D.F.Ca.US.004.03.1.1]|nr:GntR family transcriptional regulator [Mesorhizobium sp. M7D.F.Ca.US.004.03.1.1]